MGFTEISDAMGSALQDVVRAFRGEQLGVSSPRPVNPLPQTAPILIELKDALAPGLQARAYPLSFNGTILDYPRDGSGNIDDSKLIIVADLLNGHHGAAAKARGACAPGTVTISSTACHILYWIDRPSLRWGTVGALGATDSQGTATIQGVSGSQAFANTFHCAWGGFLAGHGLFAPNDDPGGTTPWILVRVEPVPQTLAAGVTWDVGVGALKQSTLTAYLDYAGTPATSTIIAGADTPSNLPRDDTTTSVSGVSNAYGDTITSLVATVSHSAGVAAPTGTVNFFLGTQSLGLANVASDGTATLTNVVVAVTPGSPALSAIYSGDSLYNGSSASASCTVTAAATSTSLTATPSSTTYGDTVTLTATVTSSSGAAWSPGGTITFKDGSTTLVTLNSGGLGIAAATWTTTGLGAGTRSLTAVYHDNLNCYADSTSSAATVTVAKATLNVTVQNTTRLYGAANPGFSVTYAGFVNGEWQTAISGDPSYSTSADSTSAVGSYLVTPGTGTLSAANYQFSFHAGTIGVNPAPLTVFGYPPISMHQGSAVPTLTADVSGALNGDTFTITCTTTATSSSPLGTYSIRPAVSGAAAANYSITLVDGVLTMLA